MGGSPDVSTSPVLAENGVMYVSGNDYFRGISSQGSVMWKQNIENGYYTYQIQSSAAVGYDGSIYIGSTDTNIYCLYSTGSIRWSFQTGGAIYSSPNIDSNGIVYIGSTDYNLYAIHPTGSVLWSYYMFSAIVSSPAIGSDGTIYVGTTAGIMYAVYPNGILRWNCYPHTPITSAQFSISAALVLSNGDVYIGSVSTDNSLYAFSSTGSVRWQFVTEGTVYSSPSLGTDNNLIVSASDTVFLYSVTQTGSLVWRFTLATNAGYTSPVVGEDGMIYYSAESLYSIYPSGSLRWKSLLNMYPQTPVISSAGVVYAGASSIIYSVGNILSTQSPLVLSNGLQPGAANPKFQGNLQNTVIGFYSYPLYICFH
jgi:outer membrane protein assembly factor BamB